MLETKRRTKLACKIARFDWMVLGEASDLKKFAVPSAVRESIVQNCRTMAT